MTSRFNRLASWGAVSVWSTLTVRLVDGQLSTDVGEGPIPSSSQSYPQMITTASNNIDNTPSTTSNTSFPTNSSHLPASLASFPSSNATLPSNSMSSAPELDSDPLSSDTSSAPRTTYTVSSGISVKNPGTKVPVVSGILAASVLIIAAGTIACILCRKKRRRKRRGWSRREALGTHLRRDSDGDRDRRKDGRANIYFSPFSHQSLPSIDESASANIFPTYPSPSPTPRPRSTTTATGTISSTGRVASDLEDQRQSTPAPLSAQNITAIPNNYITNTAFANPAQSRSGLYVPIDAIPLQDVDQTHSTPSWSRHNRVSSMPTDDLPPRYEFDRVS